MGSIGMARSRQAKDGFGVLKKFPTFRSVALNSLHATAARERRRAYPTNLPDEYNQMELQRQLAHRRICSIGEQNCANLRAPAGFHLASAGSSPPTGQPNQPLHETNRHDSFDTG